MLALALQHDAIIDDEVISDLLAVVDLGHDHTHAAANDPLYPHVRTLAVAPIRPVRAPAVAPLRPVRAPALRLYEEYHPYGSSAYRAVSSGIEVSAKRYRYTGKERDEETGLDHMGARYYAGWLGRWTSADPIGLGDGVNRYAYVRGNPVGMRDPNGTLTGSPEDDTFADTSMARHKSTLYSQNPEGERAQQGRVTAKEKALGTLKYLRNDLGIDLSPLEKALGDVAVKQKEGVKETTEWFGYVTVTLRPEILDAVEAIPIALQPHEDFKGGKLRPHLPLGEIRALVHEATHAFLLTDPEAKAVLEEVKSYYIGAPLQKGGVISGFDVERAVHEAAATYVEGRVESILNAHNNLTSAEQALAQGVDELTTQAEGNLAQATRELQALSARGKEGYIGDDDDQNEIRKSISPSLADFLDRTVLKAVSTRAEDYRALEARAVKVRTELEHRRGK